MARGLSVAFLEIERLNNNKSTSKYPSHPSIFKKRFMVDCSYDVLKGVGT